MQWWCKRVFNVCIDHINHKWFCVCPLHLHTFYFITHVDFMMMLVYSTSSSSNTTLDVFWNSCESSDTSSNIDWSYSLRLFMCCFGVNFCIASAMWYVFAHILCECFSQRHITGRPYQIIQMVDSEPLHFRLKGSIPGTGDMCLGRLFVTGHVSHLQFLSCHSCIPEQLWPIPNIV